MNGEPGKSLVETRMAVFRGAKIRRTIHEKEWWFSVVDVIEALTASANPRDYWYKMKIREKSESGVQLSTICRQLKLKSADGKGYETDCANTEGIFRIVQSVPSAKAEPFKRWLARVGYERVQEIENPELATKRTRALYKAKGYGDEWIERRMRGIAIREELTDEWKRRGLEREREYEILTAEISKATFDMTPSQYKKYKGLKRENLRDHMNDLELIFTMLGEASTTELARRRDTRGFVPNRVAARDGGRIAGNARRELETESGKKVSTRANYLPTRPRRKRLPNQ